MIDTALWFSRIACSCCGGVATNHIAGCYSCEDHRPSWVVEAFDESPTGFDASEAFEGRVVPWRDPHASMPACDDPLQPDYLADLMAEVTT